MTAPSSQLTPVLQEIFDAQERPLSSEETQRLVSLVRGALGNKANVPRVNDAIKSNDWYLIEGELRRLMSELDASAGSSSVSVQTSSEASAISSVDISAVLKVQQAISLANELDASQRNELAHLLQEAFEAAQDNRPRTVGQKLKGFLEVAADTATLAQVIGPVLLQLGHILTS